MDPETPITATNTDEWTTAIQSTGYWEPDCDRTLSVVLQSMAESNQTYDGTDLMGFLTDTQQRRTFADGYADVSAEHLEIVGRRVATLLA